MTPIRKDAFFAAALCFLLSAALLILSLLRLLEAVSIRDEISGLEREKAELERSCGVLRARLAMSLPADELERRASELGMVPCRADQIVYIEPAE